MVKYLTDWEQCVHSRSGFKDCKNEQNMMLLPLETRLGLMITSELYPYRLLIL